MTRLHPQDLRAIVEAIGLFTVHERAARKCMVEGFLAEVERAVKPEAPVSKCACPKCGGKGELLVNTSIASVGPLILKPCSKCDGKGTIPVDVGHSWPCDCQIPPMPEPLDPSGPRPPGGYIGILQDHARDLAARLEAAHALLAANPDACHWCACHLQHYPTGGECPKCAEERGAKAERERIIALFQEGIALPADTVPGSIRTIRIFNGHLRAALEPRP